MRRAGIIAVLIGALVLVLGSIVSCDNWMMDSLLGKKTVPVAVSKVNRNPAITGNPGGTVKDIMVLSATVEPADATKDINWISSRPEVAAVMTSNGGTVTLYLSGPGDTDIIAEAGAYRERIYTVHVDATVIPVTSLKLNPESITGSMGWTYQIEAIVEPPNATDQRIIWSSEDQNKVSVINGVILLRTVGGPTTIKARTQDGGYEAECKVSANLVPLDSISMSSEATGEAGGNLSLSVSFTPANASVTRLDWVSSDPSVAKVEDAGGNIKLLKVGTATITATALDAGDGEKIGLCQVEVMETGNLMGRFGAEGGTAIEKVRNTFEKIHDYLNDPSTQESLPRIELGNFINLSELHVTGYPLDTADPPNVADNNPGYGKIDKTYAGIIYKEALRLIVVGKNSFKNINENGERPHIVLQFQGCPTQHRMNSGNTNIGGYAKSEVREYLVPITGKNDSGNFSAGLVAAGVPLDREEIIWAPVRYVWQGYLDETTRSTQLDRITDKVWLPTEWEMFGSTNNSYETTASTQTYFDYYKTNNLRIKYSPGAAKVQWYFLASPTTGTFMNFYAVWHLGDLSSAVAGSGAGLGWNNNGGGISPAFCVK